MNHANESCMHLVKLYIDAIESGSVTLPSVQAKVF